MPIDDYEEANCNDTNNVKGDKSTTDISDNNNNSYSNTGSSN